MVVVSHETLPPWTSPSLSNNWSTKPSCKLVIPFLIGIVSGYLTAISVGIVDFTPLAEATLVGVPNFVLPFLHYTPNFSAVLTIAPIALVTMAEHIGDHTALGAIINKDLLKGANGDKK